MKQCTNIHLYWGRCELDKGHDGHHETEYRSAIHACWHNDEHAERIES